MGNLQGIILAVISMLAFGLSNAMSKSPSTKEGSMKTVFYRGFFNFLILIPVLFFSYKSFIFSFDYIIFTVVISFLGYIPLFTFYKALSIGKIGIVSPVANSSFLFTVLFSVFLLSEKLNLNQLFSIGFIFLGVIFISINFRDLKNSDILKKKSGLYLALITSLLWGLFFTLNKISVSALGPLSTLFIIETGIFIFGGLNLLYLKQSFKINHKKAIYEIILVSLFSCLGGLLYNLGVKNFNVGIISSIVGSSPIVVALYGKIVYKEKLQNIQWIGIFVIIIGIILLSLNLS